METYEAILTRRSVPKVGEECPPKQQITRLLEAGVRAPTHHLTQPWRFVVLAGHARQELGDAWAAAEQRIQGKDPESVRNKPLRAPAIITVIAQPKSHLPKVVDVEEHHAIGASMQNILLAAHAEGLGAMIRTGKAGEFDEVKQVLGVGPDEYIAGFIYVGFPLPDDERPATRRTPVEEITEWRGWE
jgi:nitroreductase